MRVFVTGGTGWIGSAAVEELRTRGHDVLALARTESAATALAGNGMTVLRGDLDDAEALRRGATESDAVLHLANKHDWAHPEESNRAERFAVGALADALVDTGKTFVLASGLLFPGLDRPARESDINPAVGPESLRGGSENLALEYVERGVGTVALRFAPTVHGRGDTGFVAQLVAAARRAHSSGFVGDGSAAWAAVHRRDAARLIALALEGAAPGSRIHAVAESRVSTRAIAEAIGRTLEVPTVSVNPSRAVEHFGFVGRFFSADVTATSDATRALLGWTPRDSGLIADIEGGAYSE
ncbi:nucleoside-diphosphate-sugar epimerase [Microbacteriaceae bacterium SG_E_30_P1]|uniref:Nucleoside-diphosphate-sugar epimerase n=1 Tax=Antiquaquibacter oligotrophicus TaxID=2880260 RepID=A0ABT6KSW0_9MICO|nr:NAD-dependent epimerase/dehydratase family protein [Antiquaquibacter oligotrophicus]MDH6182282.1 nucleoside-diphosphate-sugar epimerase [Antiquaquibacter oligotrophicus]UDF12061.1 NAD-dependent epimerase/dehydratase family protein [Antiquaquibacter oligotrophicus]